MPKVSVIIPVYNVEQYLDQCLESVTGQTLEDIEIIIVNDGATDGSGEKCLEWAKKDSRIIYVYKKNEGAGPARNLGISMASSEFIAFVDPDDWCDLRFIESMYSEATEKHADIVMCGWYACNAESGEIISENYPDCAGSVEVLFVSPANVFLKIYKKSLFIDNDIKMPGCLAQDAAVHGFIMTKAKTVYVLYEPLYYYRIYRLGGAVSDHRKHTKTTDYFLSYHCDLFKRDGIFEQYKDCLLVYTLKRILGWKRILIREGYDYHAWYENLERLLYSYFPGWDAMFSKRVTCLGSFNLLSALRVFAPVDMEKISEFCFSGIISVLSPAFNRSFPSHSNPFRAKAIANDFQKTFVSDLEEHGRSDYVMIDFLEERHDILAFGGGEYYTYSEALADTQAFPAADTLKRWMPATIALWQEKCLELIKLLQLHFLPEQIILVKNRLTEYYGLIGKESVYGNIDEIQLINKKLDDCYVFFENNYPGIYVVETVKLESYYTFTHFRHGRYPWHYNNEYYRNIAEEVICYINSSVKYPLCGECLPE